MRTRCARGSTKGGSGQQLAQVEGDRAEVGDRHLAARRLLVELEQRLPLLAGIAADDQLARVAVEAGIALSWHNWVGDKGRIVSIEHFGASADYKTLFEKFGITTDAVLAAAKETLAANAAA